jgi:GrpB-like predicted nucleotidyltransferase (UPF0157 family)
VIERDHPQALALLTFRDALRGDPGLRRDCAELKRRLAEDSGDNRNAYTNANGDFIEVALRRAGIEPPPRERLPE